MARNQTLSNLKEMVYVVGGIALILLLFVFSNILTAIVAYDRGNREGTQYVISSVELQKCGILKKTFKKGQNGKQRN